MKRYGTAIIGHELGDHVLVLEQFSVRPISIANAVDVTGIHGWTRLFHMPFEDAVKAAQLVDWEGEWIEYHGNSRSSLDPIDRTIVNVRWELGDAL